MPKFSASFFALFFLLPGALMAQQEKESFIPLFASTCMKYYYSQDELRSKLSSRPKLPDNVKSYFLNGVDGDAWPILESGKKYVLVLRNDGVCSLFAKEADSKLVQAEFKATVGTAPKPLVSEQLHENVGPNTQTLKSVSWQWYRPQDKSALTFTLTTSDDTSAEIAAMASMALTQKSN